MSGNFLNWLGVYLDSSYQLGAAELTLPSSRKDTGNGEQPTPNHATLGLALLLARTREITDGPVAPPHNRRSGYRGLGTVSLPIGHVSLALVLLMLVTHVILRDNHPFTANARILSNIAVAIFHERALMRTEVGNEVELAANTLPGRVRKGYLRVC
jgi:hypothetical protein